MEQFFQVGIYTNTHGIRGEIKVFPTTDDLRRFKKLKDVILRTPTGDVDLVVESARIAGQMVLLKFKGIDNINDIERWKGSGIYVTRANAVPLKKGEYYIADLIGMDVASDEGEELGKLTEVIQTGANDVYVVQKDGREILIPNIPVCILDVDVEGARMTVHLMEGLRDL